MGVEQLFEKLKFIEINGVTVYKKINLDTTKATTLEKELVTCQLKLEEKTSGALESEKMVKTTT